MKTKYFFIAAIAAVGLISCADDAFIAEAPPVNNVDEGMAPILFTSNQQAFTRADYVGADAADLLGNKFVVSGFKGNSTTTVGSMVFDNYLVEYAENTAHTTESNSDNWEYVGKGLIPHAKTNGITQQTIKYWDYTQPQYDFFAWSTGKKDAVYETTELTAGKVLVSNITPNSNSSSWATGTPTRHVYTFTGSADDLSQCYISDLVTVYKSNATGTAPFYNVVENGYQKPVTLKFRQLGTKVRIGLYETIPGYSVKNVQFYSAAASNDANSTAKIFTTEANGIYKEGTYTVYFPTVDQPTNADNNQAHIEFAPKAGADQSTVVNWGNLNYTYRESGETSADDVYLGRTSNTASFAGKSDDNYYVIYLPNQNGTNLNLRVNYTLESIDGSKETITVKGANAQVPLIYTQWKPGYAYTYLFKISDKTNGHTGEYNPLFPDDVTVNSDPAGLYPITFDALVVNAEENAKQETITTVSTPSITTYQKGSNVVNQNEYDHATGPIFVTVNDGNLDYEQVTVASGESVYGYYTMSGSDYIPITDVNATSDGTGPYYRMMPTVEKSGIVELKATGAGLATLYTLPTDKAYTEADVVDALQMQDDVSASFNGIDKSKSVTGRSGLVLTPATFTLETSIEYGVDGNAINLATLNANALKFTAAAAGIYAFVYTKKAIDPSTNVNIYQAVTKVYEDDPATQATESPESVEGLYRYKLVAATADKDVEKGVTYFQQENASTPAITAFLGQNVDNLFTRSGSSGSYVYTPARGYAQTGTTYYYTLDGQYYQAATTIAYADFKSTTLYTDAAHTTTKDTSLETPVDGQAYYDNNGKYCVIFPQRTNGLYVLNGKELVDANMVPCETGNTAVKGMTYFDKYIQNKGVYYTKIIKVE